MRNLIHLKLISLSFVLILLYSCQKSIKTGKEFSISDLAPKPPLGWNSYDGYGVYINSKTTLANIEVFAEKYKPFGYEYFVIDAGWFREYELIPGTNFPAKRLDLALDDGLKLTLFHYAALIFFVMTRPGNCPFSSSAMRISAVPSASDSASTRRPMRRMSAS